MKIFIKDFNKNSVKIGDTVIPVLDDISRKVPGRLAAYDPGSTTPYRIDYADPAEWVWASKIIKCKKGENYGCFKLSIISCR